MYETAKEKLISDGEIKARWGKMLQQEKNEKDVVVVDEQQSSAEMRIPHVVHTQQNSMLLAWMLPWKCQPHPHVCVI